MNMNRAINMIFIRPLVAFALAALLIVATCLSVAAPALAQEGERWETTCDSDGWDDVVCTAKSPVTRSSREFFASLIGDSPLASRAMYQCAKKADGTKEGFYGLEVAIGIFHKISWGAAYAGEDSEGRAFYNVPMRWDDEPPNTAAFWLRKRDRDDGGGWVLAWKNQPQVARQFGARGKLRIRPSIGGEFSDPEPTAFTYSLLGATEAIGEAARKCGF